MSKTIEELELERDDLVAQQQTIMAQRKELKAKGTAVQAQIDMVSGQIEAQKKLERMSDAEKQALLQSLQAEGIDSEEVISDI